MKPKDRKKTILVSQNVPAFNACRGLGWTSGVDPIFDERTVTVGRVAGRFSRQKVGFLN